MEVKNGLNIAATKNTIETDHEYKTVLGIKNPKKSTRLPFASFFVIPKKYSGKIAVVIVNEYTEFAQS